MKTKIIILVFALMALSGIAAADAVVTVGLTNAQTNSTANVNVSIAGVPDIYAVQFDIHFDPTGLSLSGDTPGALFTVPGGFTSLGSFIDNAGGNYYNAGYTFFGSSGVDGNGVLLTLNFNTSNVIGFSFVNIDNIILLDSNLDPVNFTAENGGVVATPEPGSLVLLGSGILGAAGTLRRRILG